jgi:TetR/AcrR family tetracycline transcriptional repressor
MDVSPEEDKQSGLTRERVVAEALALINEEGLEGLSMRALADRLEVKAASLYWHVRDRRELLELLAEAILATVARPRQRESWRATVLAITDALGSRIAAQKDAGRILLEEPDALERSDTFAGLKTQLQGAGLQAAEAADLALLAMTYVIGGRARARAAAEERIRPGAPALIAIDTGSRGVVVRAGGMDMQELVQRPHERAGASPAVVRGETVVVRRLRGVGLGEIELNPRRPWSFKVHAPTWNTVLDVGGLDVREIHVDSGATKVECYLPVPHGVVPIHISSGVVGVALHRPKGVAVIARVHTGAVKLKLDAFATKVAVFDVHWQSDGPSVAPDRYELEVSSGVMNFALDTYVPRIARVVASPAEPEPAGKPASALEILLDGVESRVRARG